MNLENSQREAARLKKEVESVEPYEIDGLKIEFNGYPTLTDGKVKVNWSEWEKKAMTNCVICRASPKQMSKRHGKWKVNENHFALGIACLHVRLCAFTWLCKGFLYKDFKRWSKDGPAEQALIDARKAELQRRFLEELDLPVYFTSQTGNSNDGNCARKAFENYEVFARIIEQPVDLVRDLGYMLDTINSSVPLDADEFEMFANDWLDRQS